MPRTLLALAALLATAGVGSGQGYPGNPYLPAPAGAIPAAGALPNFYNRQYQPLSPYLNLVRGGNPAVNYYYGVRPGQIANGQLPGGAAFPGGFRGAVLTQPAAGPADPAAVPDAAPGARPSRAATYSTGLGVFTGVSGGGAGRPVAQRPPSAVPPRPAPRR